MTVIAIAFCLYAAARFAGLARYVWSEGYSTIWVAFEALSAVVMVAIAIWLLVA